MATRRTQPYRQGPRKPTGALAAQIRGRTAHGYHPKDAMRLGMRRNRKARKRGGLTSAVRRRLPA